MGFRRFINQIKMFNDYSLLKIVIWTTSLLIQICALKKILPYFPRTGFLVQNVYAKFKQIPAPCGWAAAKTEPETQETFCTVARCYTWLVIQCHEQPSNAGQERLNIVLSGQKLQCAETGLRLRVKLGVKLHCSVQTHTHTHTVKNRKIYRTLNVSLCSFSEHLDYIKSLRCPNC